MELVMDSEVELSGTHLQGHIECAYAELVKAFGEPILIAKPDMKTDAEWHGRIDGEVFTIYNYKDGKNYLGEDGLEVLKITYWHIGGFTALAFEKVREVLSLK